ncbi:Ribosomal large subunit pseudouridine synthase D [Chlamydiales bacterium SCGC AG-110-P3]|nr:Ribosomal large subunit pseudouridine synthase D [Chlamydiales bacterium SCGC AG-110-P3]
MKPYQVTQSDTVLQALRLAFPDSSSNTLRSWIQEERILVDGSPVKQANAPVEAGQLLVLTPKAAARMPKGLKELYRDEYIVVVDKPVGLLTVATDNGTQPSVHAILKKHLKPSRIYPVHRLDRGTSGALVFALTEESRDALKELFMERNIDREYVAIVEGHVEEDEGTWESNLYQDRNFKVHSTSDPRQSKLAITNYKVEERGRAATRLALKLETGRKNQIRVHCADAGHPVVGDRKYEANGNPIARLCLHALRLGFTHPITGKTFSFTSPVPPRFEDALRHPTRGGFGRA